MHTPDASGLLDLWESGFNLSSPHRSLALLALAHPQARHDELTALSLGRRDALLLRLRERLFGTGLDFVATCPACASVVESRLDIARLQVDPPTPEPRMLQVGERSLTFRPPTLGDLLGLPIDPAAARLALVSRCLVNDTPDSAVESLPAQVIDAISAAMSGADPAADAELALDCPDCGQRWQIGFDIATFLWREIDTWARRTLRDVHALARAYAWREQDVLAMSPTRRQMYLELSRA